MLVEKYFFPFVRFCRRYNSRYGVDFCKYFISKEKKVCSDDIIYDKDYGYYER